MSAKQHMFDSVAASEATLTTKQQAVLEVVREYAAQNGYPPTVREIAQVLGVSSTSTVHSHLAALERAGVLERDPTKPRALRWHTDVVPPVEPVVIEDSSSINLPLIGRVAAGAPILAEQHVEEHVRVPAMLTKRGDSFLLKIHGESMIDAGILDGDYVVVRMQQTANDGEIVIAVVDDEATCKRLAHRDGRVVLMPANETMEPIIPETCHIAGVVTGVLRAL